VSTPERCLRLAARRWPAALRDELLREWLAELSAVGSGPARWRFALSLLVSPPIRDAAGVPRGWGEAVPAVGPGAALLVAGLLLVGVFQLFGLVVDPLIGAVAWNGGSTCVQALLLTPVAVLTGWWLGRRLPMAADGRFGAATSAAFASLPLLPAFLIIASPDLDPVSSIAFLIAALVWTPGIAVLGVLAVRGRRLLAVAGTVLVSVLATALATVPLALGSTGGVAGGVRAAVASLLLRDPPAEYEILYGDTSRTFYAFGPWAFVLTAYGLLAVTYGLSATEVGPGRAAKPAPVSTAELRPIRPALIAGVVCLVVGVVAWAYTVTVLSPAMPGVSELAPMPGGDGEIYLWVGELRWGAVLFAALGLLVATADRRAATRASALLGAGLLTADFVLLRHQVSGTGGLRLALAIGAAITGLAWLVARAPLDGHPEVARRRITVVAIAATACGPQLYLQGTPAVNHPYLPLGLPVTTAVVAIAATLLGTIGAATVSVHPLSRPALAALIGLPPAILAGTGLFFGNGVDETVTEFGMLIGLPLAVVVIALTRRHRPRRRGRTVALWTAIALAGVPGTTALFFFGILVADFVPNLLFALEGTSYPADGISVLPGAALLMLPVAALITSRRRPELGYIALSGGSEQTIGG
jgi:hypothetical protein